MRQGVGAGFPHHEGGQRPRVADHGVAPMAASAQTRSNISRLFWDLRNALRMTPHQAAAQLQTRVDIIEALETGQFELLPQGPETARIVMTYTGMAGIDGRPVLAALADLMRDAAARAQPSRSQSSQRLRQAGTAFANGAKRLPAGALKQVRERPDRAFYAVSLPLGIVLLLLNTSVLQAAFNHVPRPVARLAQNVRQYFQVEFAPVREGLRWIEVDDPRRRRGDKLPIGG
jgi:Helix-turn-helix domain